MTNSFKISNLVYCPHNFTRKLRSLDKINKHYYKDNENSDYIMHVLVYVPLSKYFLRSLIFLLIFDFENNVGL